MPIKGGQLTPGTVGSTQLGTGAVGSTQLASGAVTSGAIGAGAVGASNIAAGVVGDLWTERYPALATTGSGQKMCSTGITYTPAGEAAGVGILTVLVNGLGDYTIGNGVKTADLYFATTADSSGATALALTAIVAGCIPWSGSKSGSYCASLVTSDEITYAYSRSVS